jgi:integrase
MPIAAINAARGGPFTADGVNRHLKRIGESAGLPTVHAHMLRHGCGYALANAGHDTRAIQDWLGHRSIQHTVRYTELTPTWFRGERGAGRKLGRRSLSEIGGLALISRFATRRRIRSAE